MTPSHAPSSRSVDPTRGSSRESLVEYLRRGDSRSREIPAVTAWGRFGRAIAPRAAIPSAKSCVTWLCEPWMRRRARALRRTGSEIRLHLGCGGTYVRGWTNVDLFGSRADLYWDLRRPLPFPDESVSAVFHEHVLEHFDLPGAIALLAECRRVLRPGGVLRVGVPDFGRYAESYVRCDGWLEELRPGRPARVLALAEVAHGDGHRTLWDEDLLLRAFATVELDDHSVRRFGDSSLEPAPDGAHRAAETLYVEARR